MRLVIAALAISCFAVGCEERLGPERIQTVPVHGTVRFKGLPAQKLSVTLHAQDARSGVEAYTSNPTAMTDADGSFVLSTYEHGDGVAPGTYVVTMEWLTYKPLGNQWSGPDKLGGKYADPKKSPFKVTVTGDEEVVELEPFELTK